MIKKFLSLFMDVVYKGGDVFSTINKLPWPFYGPYNWCLLFKADVNIFSSYMALLDGGCKSFCECTRDGVYGF